MGTTIFRYFIRAVVPYFLTAWVLLSVVLFVQQASRFSEILFDVNIPVLLSLQLSLALIPNVISFTAPMALLVGTVIGLARMEESFEITAAMAAGFSPLQVALPIALFGLLVSAFAFAVNAFGLPTAAALTRSVATRSAIKKLEDPIEPGSISKISGLTVYVNEGDIETGRWKDLFIFSDSNPDRRMRLITASTGRIDVAGDRSELVLENALVTTLPAKAEDRFAVETASDVRFAVQTGREVLVRRLSEMDLSPEELGIFELSGYADSREGADKIEAQLIQQRRILLSAAPLIFALLGTFVALRVRRRGRGIGVLVSLLILIGFYLLTFLGEQLARTQTVPVVSSILFPLVGSAIAITLLLAMPRTPSFANALDIFSARARSIGNRNAPSLFDRLLDVSSGIRDFEIGVTLARYYLTSVIFLSAIFLVFTAFELWKFAGAFDGGVSLLGHYMVYILPFVYLQIAPISAMLATVATYAIKSGQNEIVGWVSSGVSGYRLMVPSLILLVLLGAANLAIAEYIAPSANQQQDQTRALMRSKGVPLKPESDVWQKGDSAFYRKASVISASDNNTANNDPLTLILAVPRDGLGSSSQILYRAAGYYWSAGRLVLAGNVQKLRITASSVVEESVAEPSFPERVDPFAGRPGNPNHLALSELRSGSDNSGSETERHIYRLAYNKRLSLAITPLFFSLVGIAFGLKLGRKGNAVAVAKAVLLSLVYLVTAGIFEQFGRSGSLSPGYAVWGPILVFLLVAIFFTSRMRT